MSHNQPLNVGKGGKRVWGPDPQLPRRQTAKTTAVWLEDQGAAYVRACVRAWEREKSGGGGEGPGAQTRENTPSPPQGRRSPCPQLGGQPGLSSPAPLSPGDSFFQGWGWGWGICPGLQGSTWPPHFLSSLPSTPAPTPQPTVYTTPAGNCSHSWELGDGGGSPPPRLTGF